MIVFFYYLGCLVKGKGKKRFQGVKGSRGRGEKNDTRIKVGGKRLKGAGNKAQGIYTFQGGTRVYDYLWLNIFL